MKKHSEHSAGAVIQRDERSQGGSGVPTHTHSEWLRSFTGRIEKIASEKLGVPVTVARWDELKTGARQPVFSVPESHREQAMELGLAVA